MTPKNKYKFKDNLLILNLSSHKMPEFREVPNKNWIYYGEKNNWPQHLLDLYYKCSKHNAIVNGKVKYISGMGWLNSEKVEINTDGESLNQFTNKVVLDSELYNGAACEVIWNNAGTAAEFRHVDFSKIRSNKDNTEFYYASTWHTKSGAMVSNPTLDPDWTIYKPFDLDNRKGEQLLYYKSYSPGLETYPLPEYKAALIYIELEYQIANYWFNRVKNGFSASAILNFYMGQPTDDEMNKLEEKIKQKFAGTDNAGQFIMNFASGKDFAADVQQLQSPELSKEYESLNSTLQTEIFTGHGITNGMLFGIKEPGQLGGRNELIEANELFQNRYVSPKQLQIEMFFRNYIFPYIKTAKGELSLSKQAPIGADLLGNEKAFLILTDQEKRIAIGKEPILKDKKNETSERIINNINTLSPLIANEVLKSMTQNEIRQLAGLQPIKGGDEMKSNNLLNKEKFSKYGTEDISPCIKKLMDEGKSQEQAIAICISKRERGLLDEFKRRGKKRKGQILGKRAVTYEMSRNLKASEEEMKMQFKDERVPPVIVGSPVKKIIPESPEKPTEIISVVYYYDWIEGFSDADEDTSREFCIDLMEMSREGKRWTREDIEDISTAGYEDSWGGDADIWSMRGGWYTLPGTDTHRPSCRHQWIQEVIRETIE